VALAFLEGVRVDLLGYLFGDVLAVGPTDLAWIWGGGAVVLAGLALLWRRLLMVSVHPDLAAAEGVAVLPVRLAFMLMLAVLTAVAMKVVGVLLITSMLIVPAAAARRLAATPEAMAAGAVGVGAVSVVAGLALSYAYDLPSGPAIVVSACALFAASLAAGAVTRRE
jgi:zinc transport system permease protein